MSGQFNDITIQGDEVTDTLFGGNILAYRGEMEGEGQYETAIEHLGITDLRYPGGSTTEYYFDIYNPDSSIATHVLTGEVIDFIPVSEFMMFAAENGHAVTIVLPTRHSFSEETDGNGHREIDVDESAVRQYVRDIVDGKYGDAEVRAFEIGNEYWLSGGMDSVEYGRVAAAMVDIVDDELLLLSEDNPDAEQIDIVVQMGKNYGSARMTDEFEGMPASEIIDYFNDTYDLEMGDEALYSSGDINLNHISNELIMGELEKSEEIENVDGVVAHVYSLGETNTWSKVFELNEIEDTWLEDYPDLEIYVTEWNMKGVTATLDGSTDYGLYQATEMLNIVEEFVTFDVDFANVWPLIQNTDNSLNRGFSYDDPNAPGEFFSIMREILPGKKLLDFQPNDNFKTEANFEDFSVHGFADPDELSLFVTTNHTSGIVESDLDITELVQAYGNVKLSILGVEKGSAPGDNDSNAFVEELNPETSIEDGIINVPLDPGEILIVRLFEYEPTPELAQALGIDLEEVYAVDDPLIDNFEIPTVEITEEQVVEAEDEEPMDVDDGSDGLVWLIALLPLLALFGLG